MSNVKPKLTLSKQKKIADEWFSRYIRYRDGQKFINTDTGQEEWWCQCITCETWRPLVKMHAGHFQSRRYLIIRWDEFNVNAQCAGCNNFGNGEQYKYAKAIDLKYGGGTAETLAKLAQQTKKFTIEDLQKIIDDAKKQVEMYLTY